MENKTAPRIPAEKVKVDPNAAAKAAFEQALEKTKGQSKPEELDPDPVVETVKREPKEPKKAEAPDHSKEIAALRAELAELKKPKEQPKAPPKQSDFEAIQRELEEQFGEDEGKILASAMKAAIEPREQRIAQMEDMLRKAFDQSSKATAKANKARLSKEYELSDDAWDIIQERAQKHLSEGKYTSADEAYDAVALTLYGKATKAHNEEAEEQASRIAASTPTQPSAARRERKMTANQKSWEIFEHLRKNPHDKAGAMELATKLKVDRN